MDDSSFFAMASSEAQQQADAGLLVRFEWADVPDADATEKAGYPQFRRRERVCIRIPGRDERFDWVKEEHRRRFPRAYAAFKAGTPEKIDGTPLSDWPGTNKNEVSMLGHYGVLSVEQLAGTSDESISLMGHGVRPIRDRAKAWLEARKSNKPVAELQSALKERDEKIEALTDRLLALESALTAKGTAIPTEKPKRIRKKAEKPLES
jgi:hypothetical protein